MRIDVTILKEILGEECEFIGNETLVLKGIQSIYECNNGNITWIKPGVKEEDKLINDTVASCILCSKESFKLFNGNLENKLFIIHDDPKMLYLYVNKFIADYNSTNDKIGFIHPTAIIHPDCKIGENVSIGAFSIIGSCEIGAETKIGDYVKIFDCVEIGNNCDIREFSSIGGKGLGYYKKVDETLEHIPHLGKVKIGSNVHIYPFVNVDQGTLGTTTIDDGAAIDHHVHIGHNSHVGKNSILVCGTVMAGGSKILDNCFIGANTQLKQKCIVGNRVITGMGAVVTKDIPDNQVWAGNPAKFLKETPNQLF